MWWYILQGVVFCLGVASSALWYEPGGQVTAQQAAFATGGIAVASAWAVTAVISWLNALSDRRHARYRTGAERVAGRGNPLIK
jgi:hypothetical protein